MVNRIGELLDSIMVEVQTVVDMIRETDNDSLIYDILAENLKKWKDDILELINSVSVCAKPDTKKKDKTDTKKKDKPDTKKKDKPDTKKKDKPDNEKRDKPDIEKKDKPDIEKKDKPDIEKHRNVLEHMICGRVRILLTMLGHLLKSTENTCMVDNVMLFNDFCARSRVRIVDDEARNIIEKLYSVDIALHSLQDVLKWKKWVKSIRYGSITTLKALWKSDRLQIFTYFMNM